MENKERDLEGKCLWVPASVKHHVAANSSLFIYGGVRVLPKVNVINSSDPRHRQVMNNAFNAQGRATVNNSSLAATNNRINGGNRNGGASSNNSGIGGINTGNLGKNSGGNRHQSNFIQGLKQRVELSLQEKNIIGSNGRLTDFARMNSKIILEGKHLKDPIVISELTKNGSSMKDWRKYTTTVQGEVTLSRSIQQPLDKLKKPLKDGHNFAESTTRSFEVHYYMNHKTGEVCYLNGFKVKGDISLLPKDGKI